MLYVAEPPTNPQLEKIMELKPEVLAQEGLL
jgi:hypothetical protein